MGKSEEREDWLGKKYTVHYDDDGTEIGRSEEREDWLGNKYTQHSDMDHNKIGRSKSREDWLGKEYTQHYDRDDKEEGRSKEREDWLGNEFTQHYDRDDNKEGRSEKREDWLGNRYVHHEEANPHVRKTSSGNSDTLEANGAGGRVSAGGSYIDDEEGFSVLLIYNPFLAAVSGAAIALASALLIKVGKTAVGAGAKALGALPSTVENILSVDPFVIAKPIGLLTILFVLGYRTVKWFSLSENRYAFLFVAVVVLIIVALVSGWQFLSAYASS